MFFTETENDNKQGMFTTINPHKRRLKSLIPRNSRAFPDDFFEAKDNNIFHDPLKMSQIFSNNKQHSIHSILQRDSSPSDTLSLTSRKPSVSGNSSAREKHPFPPSGLATSRIHETLYNNSRGFRKLRRGSLNATKEIQSARETRTEFVNYHYPIPFPVVRKSLQTRVIPKITTRPTRPQRSRFSSNSLTDNSYHHESTDPISITNEHELSFAENHQSDELMSFRSNNFLCFKRFLFVLPS